MKGYSVEWEFADDGGTSSVLPIWEAREVVQNFERLGIDYRVVVFDAFPQFAAFTYWPRDMMKDITPPHST